MTAHTDGSLARTLAHRAGELLLRLRAAPPPDRPPGPAADAAAQDLIATALRHERPDDVLFSEEAPDPVARSSASRVWIVDPLDGTREFAEVGRSDWAVHVALWADGELVAGAVALPALGVTYATDAPPAVPPADGGPLRLAVSRSRPPAFVAALAEELGARLVPMGSAGVKASAVWTGEVDAYVHAGGQYEWDSAAPVAVARAAGLHASRLDGSPLRYNRPDPLLPDLVVCRPERAAEILAAVARGAQEVTL